MKKQFRSKVFETNSSSVHTLTWNMPKKIVLSDDLDIKDGVLTICCRDFKEDMVVKGQKEKFEYLATKIFRNHWWEFDTRESVSSKDEDCPWELMDVSNVVYQYFPEIKEIVVKNIGGASMDYNWADSERIVDVCNDMSVAQFLFVDELTVKIYMD